MAIGGREAQVYPGAAAGAQPDADAAIQAVGALAQDDQAIVAGALLLGPDADAVVFDLDVDGADAVLGQAQPAMLGLGVLDHVAQRLADDLQAVHFLVGRQWAVVELIVVLDQQPGVGAELLDGGLQGGFQPRLVDLDAEGGEQLAQLAVGRIEPLIICCTLSSSCA